MVRLSYFIIGVGIMIMGCTSQSNEQKKSKNENKEKHAALKRNHMDPTIQSLLRFFQRDLEAFQSRIKKYKYSDNLWEIPGAVNNSPAHLCLHVEGNLKYFIGGVLGDTGYERDRNFEFKADSLPRDTLLHRLEETKQVVKTTLEKLDPERLDNKYPQQVLDEPHTVRHFLIHLSTHLRYHLGQLDYHYRIVEGSSSNN